MKKGNRLKNIYSFERTAWESNHILKPVNKYFKLLTSWAPPLMSTQSQLVFCIFLLESWLLSTLFQREQTHVYACLKQISSNMHKHPVTDMLFQANNNIKAEESVKFQVHQFLICRLLCNIKRVVHMSLTLSVKVVFFFF